MGQAALSNEKQSAPFFCVYPKAPPQSSSPSPVLPKGFALIPSVFEAVGSSSLSLGKVGMGLRTKAMYGWFIVDGMHPDNAVGFALSRRRNSQMVCVSSSNSIEVALSRRRYPHQLNASATTADNSHHDSHRHGFLCFHSSNDNQPLNPFFYAHLHTFCPKSVEV